MRNMKDKAFSSVDYVGQCLLDKKRTTEIINSINKTVKEGDVVLDCGTGSAILAIKAAEAGASKVFAVELDPYIAYLAEKNVKTNNLEGKIEIINRDTRRMNFKLERPVNVVIMEMLTTGMIDEFQIQTLLNLKRHNLVDEKTIFIPGIQKSFLTLGYSNFEIYRTKIVMPLHLWDIHANKHDYFSSLSDKVVFDSYNFNTDERKKLNTLLNIKNTNDGIINSVLLESQSILNSESILEETPALNGKVLIPLEEEKVVKKGDILNFRINYKYGEGFKNVELMFI